MDKCACKCKQVLCNGLELVLYTHPGLAFAGRKRGAEVALKPRRSGNVRNRLMKKLRFK